MIPNGEVYNSEYFIDYSLGIHGDAMHGRLLDTEQITPDWPTVGQEERLTPGSSIEEANVSIYGLAVYRDYKKTNAQGEIPRDDAGGLNLEPAIFFDGTDLLKVLSEAAHCAIDSKDPAVCADFVDAIYSGVRSISANRDRFQAEAVTELVSAIFRISSGEERLFEALDVEQLAKYVDFIVKTAGARRSESAATNLRFAADRINSIEVEKDVGTNMNNFAKQTLLKRLAVAWIDRDLDPQAIDWLGIDQHNRQTSERSESVIN